MNSELRSLTDQFGLNTAEMEAVRLDFCFACVSRISHLLELDEVVAAFQDFKAYREGRIDKAQFEVLKKSIFELANKHPGSRSLDGTKHSAVSATYALANAINGNPVAAAEYAAYSSTYGYGGYAAGDMESYQEEYCEQVKILKKILRQNS